MRLRQLTLTVLCTVIAIGSVTPAFAFDGWRERDEWRRQAWRRHEWREHEWRERAWREHEWREHNYAPPALAVRPDGFSSPPPVYYTNQWPFR